MENETFLGTIQIASKSELTSCQIVDGRQRLTTLALIYAVCCQMFSNKTDHKIMHIIDDQNLNETLAGIVDESIQLEIYGTIGSRGDITRLSRAGKEKMHSETNIYHRNANLIYTLLKVSKHFEKMEYAHARDMVENTFFITVEIMGQEMSRVIRIFDTLNSTGQALSDEAMFKIRYHSYISFKNSNLESSYIMNSINASYDLVEQYNRNTSEDGIKIAMRDCLWAYRTFLIMKHSKDGLFDGTDLSLGSLNFFETLFQKENCCDESLTLGKFQEFLKLYIEYYDLYYSQMALESIANATDAIDRTLSDFLSWTRYSTCWAVPISAYVYFRCSNNPADAYNKSVVRSRPLLQVLSFYSLIYQKGIKYVKTSFIKDALEKIAYGDIDAFCKERIIEADKNRSGHYSSFWKCMKYDLYDSYGSAYMFLAALEIDEEMKQGDNFYQKIGYLFPWKKSIKRPQIEHIYAYKIFSENKSLSIEEKQEFNGLGNFVLLEESTNKNALKDKVPSIKIHGNEGKKFFLDSKMALVKKLLKTTSDLANMDDANTWLQQVIRVRFETARSRICEIFPLFKEVE